MRISNYELYEGVVEHATAETLLSIWRDYAAFLLRRTHASTTELAALYALRDRWARVQGICLPCDDPTVICDD